jgi:hypothetical protein
VVSHRLVKEKARVRTLGSPFGILLDMVALGQALLRVIRFPLPTSFHRYNIFTHLCNLFNDAFSVTHIYSTE